MSIENLLAETNKLAASRNVSRTVDSVAVGKDGSGCITISVSIRGKSEGQIIRWDKYQFYYNITKENIQSKVDHALARGLVRFLNLPYDATILKEDVEDLPPVETKPVETKPLEPPKEEVKEEKPKPKRPRKKAAKVVKAEKAKPEVVVEEKPENVIFDKKNKTHTAYLKQVLEDTVGPQWKDHKTKALKIVADVNGVTEVTNPQGLMLPTFETEIRRLIEKHLDISEDDLLD